MDAQTHQARHLVVVNGLNLAWYFKNSSGRDGRLSGNPNKWKSMPVFLNLFHVHVPKVSNQLEIPETNIMHIFQSMSILDDWTRCGDIYLQVHGKLRQKDYHKSEASLGYTMSLRPINTGQWGLVSKDHTPRQKKSMALTHTGLLPIFFGH